LVLSEHTSSAHFCFILIGSQRAYFKCAYDCFDRRRTQEGINSCVENCSVPVLTANNVVENEMAKFQVLLISCNTSIISFFCQIEHHRILCSSFFRCWIPLCLCSAEIMIGYFFWCSEVNSFIPVTFYYGIFLNFKLLLIFVLCAPFCSDFIDHCKFATTRMLCLNELSYFLYAW